MPITLFLSDLMLSTTLTNIIINTPLNLPLVLSIVNIIEHELIEVVLRLVLPVAFLLLLRPLASSDPLLDITSELFLVGVGIAAAV